MRDKYKKVAKTYQRRNKSSKDEVKYEMLCVVPVVLTGR